MGVAVALGAGMSVAAGLALARLDASAPNIELRVAIAEPASLAVITMLMMLVASAATYVPVRRAAKADPVSALRHT